jgi:hypothetical protein
MLPRRRRSLWDTVHKRKEAAGLEPIQARCFAKIFGAADEDASLNSPGLGPNLNVSSHAGTLAENFRRIISRAWRIGPFARGYRIVLLGNVEYIDEIAATASLAAGMTPFPLEALGRRELR